MRRKQGIRRKQRTARAPALAGGAVVQGQGAGMVARRRTPSSADLVANQLDEIGHRGLRALGLKPKHVEKLAAHWLAEELSPGTIKNRMSVLRWVAQKLGKDNIVARDNAAYGIPDRVYVTNISKAKGLGMDQVEGIRTPCAQVSLRLQAAFGLRREASIFSVPRAQLVAEQ